MDESRECNQEVKLFIDEIDSTWKLLANATSVCVCVTVIAINTTICNGGKDHKNYATVEGMLSN